VVSSIQKGGKKMSFEKNKVSYKEMCRCRAIFEFDEFAENFKLPNKKGEVKEVIKEDPEVDKNGV
jgi:hypothetical protein